MKNASPPPDDPTTVSSRRAFLFKTVAILPAGAVVTASGQTAASGSAAASAPSAPANGAGMTAAEPVRPASIDLAHYTPHYFNADEWAFIKAATDRLIPADGEGPGALDLNVPVFIDKQMDAGFGHASNWYMSGPFKPDTPSLWGYQNPLKPRDLYRAAIAAINDHCRQTFSGKVFADLEHAQQEQLLTDMEGGKVESDKAPIKDFFGFLLQNTKEGYLADPIYGGNKDAGSWRMIGFPGARADFLDWVGQNKRYPLPPVSIDSLGPNPSPASASGASNAQADNVQNRTNPQRNA